MKRRTSRPGVDPVTGPLRRSLPLLLQSLLVAALALPAGVAVAPAFLGPSPSETAPQSTPPQPAGPAVPAPPSAPQGFRARKLAELDQRYSEGELSMEDYMAQRADIMKG